MNNKGFTLVEIIAVIALIGIVSIIIIPNVVDTLNDSTNKTMKVQEKELSEAGLLYLEDFCKNPINNNVCPNSISRNSDYTYSGKINLNTLVSYKYIDDITLNEKSCNGCVIITNNEAVGYLSCGEDYKSSNYKCD